MNTQDEVKASFRGIRNAIDSPLKVANTSASDRLKYLNGKLEELRARLNVLGQRLEPILLPESPSKASSLGDPGQQLSPTSEQVIALMHNVETMIYITGDLLERLDI